MAHLGRIVKNVEAPRPLKSQSRSSLKNNFMVIEELIQLIENVALSLQAGHNQTEPMAMLMQNLRVHGPQLETVSKDTLDRAFVVFRNASQDERLNIMTRLNLLELIELRAKSWEDNGINAYYKTKQASNVEIPDSQHHVDLTQAGYLSTSPTFGGSAAAAAAIAAVGSAQQQQLFLGPGEVICNSGKFPKPTKIPGKTYCKDEVVIRNGDSGKVMGIKGRRVHMIEELSETIISFQRVNPGAKERLVQITGPTEEKINYAKQLIEDTIRRNASPVRLEPNSASGGNNAVAGGGSCSSLASSNSDEVQPRTPGVSSALANRLSFNSDINFMRAAQHNQEVLNMINTPVTVSVPVAGPVPVPVATAGKELRQPSQLLLHSFSTNDASLGEYKYTVNVGQNMIKITGDCCELVRVAKLVLDDYFSSAEFLASVEVGATFEGSTLMSPISTPTTPLNAPRFAMGTPLADSGIGLNYMAATQASLANNLHDGDDEVFSNDANGLAAQNNALSRSRRSHFSRKDGVPEGKKDPALARLKSESTATSNVSPVAVVKTQVSRISYDNDHLLFFSQSPHSWALPYDWERICEKFPTIVRNKVTDWRRPNNNSQHINYNHMGHFDHLSNANKNRTTVWPIIYNNKQNTNANYNTNNYKNNNNSTNINNEAQKQQQQIQQHQQQQQTVAMPIFNNKSNSTSSSVDSKTPRTNSQLLNKQIRIISDIVSVELSHQSAANNNESDFDADVEDDDDVQFVCETTYDKLYKDNTIIIIN